MSSYTRRELMVVAAAREIRDREVVFVGIISVAPATVVNPSLLAVIQNAVRLSQNCRVILSRDRSHRRRLMRKEYVTFDGFMKVKSIVAYHKAEIACRSATPQPRWCLGLNTILQRRELISFAW